MNSNKLFNNHRTQNSEVGASFACAERGFTLIELLVSVGIFTIVATIVLANYPLFGSRIVLENVAHQVGLTIRQSQSYGLNVRVFGGGTNTFPTYGTHFSLSGITANDPADRTTFLIFADIIPNNGMDDIIGNDIYDGESGCQTSGGECVESFTIQSHDQIYLLCGNLQTHGETYENPVNADCSLSALDIVFTRPSPEATITGYSQSLDAYTTFTDATVVVRSPRGEYREVVVWSTGQISVE